MLAQAAPPTTSATNITASTVDGRFITFHWTNGNGNRRIVVMTTNTAVTGRPADGIDYTENAVFGQGPVLAPGEYIVGDLAGTSLTVSGLQPATTYSVAIFEYNGSGFSTEYLPTPGVGSLSTSSTPTSQVSALTITNITPAQAVISWTKGSGPNTLILVREGTAVNSVPSDLSTYSTSPNFGSGAQIGSGNYVVYNGPSTYLELLNLKGATTYHIAVFSYNGSSGPLYLTPGATTSFTTADRPTRSATDFRQNVADGLSLQAIWNSGNGSKRILVASENGPVTGLPVDGTDYAENSTFGAGATLNSGEYVVYDGNNFIAGVTGLQPEKDYYFRLFEYIVVDGSTRYRTSDAPAGILSTAKRPTVNVSNPFVTYLRADYMRLNFTSGNGKGRLILIKKGSPVDASPTDLVQYTPSQSYGSGSEIGNGNFANSGDNVQNLEPGVTYHFAFYEYNGQINPMYMQTPVRFSATTLSRPTTGPSAPTQTPYATTLRLGWTRGNGNYCIVIGKKGGAITSTPADNTTYTANATLGAGDRLSPDEFVVFAGNNNTCEVSGLTAATEYSFRIFEYNIVAGSPVYLTDESASITASTLAPPTTQASNIVASDITQTSITLTWSNGNGSGSLIVGKEGTAVDAEPEDGILYSVNTYFGNGQSLGNSNYAITRSYNSVTVTNLQPGTTYHFAAFGFIAPNVYDPAFQRNNPARASFTTQSGVSKPTVASSALQFTAVEGNKLGISWTKGNGSNRLVIARAGNAVSFDPVDGNTYSPNPDFGTGTDLGGGQYIVYNGTGNSFDLANLEPGTTYHLEIFEYNGSGTDTKYLTTTSASGSQATVSAPGVGSSAFTVSNITASQATISWTNGNGIRRLVLIKVNEAVDAIPVNLTAYTAHTLFGSGAQPEPGNYTVYAGTGSTVTVTGLTGGRSYHVAVFEYNGSQAPMYKMEPLRGSFVTIGAPATQTSSLVCTPFAKDSVRLQWNNGSGQYRLILARRSVTVNQQPVNDHEYTADEVFGNGELLGTDVYVVYKGNGSSAVVKGLQGNNTYHFAVFEYNDFSNGIIRYQLTNPARSSITMPVTLPLSLIQFGTQADNGVARLNWSTAWENNLDRFDIMISRDGIQFSKLGSVAARNRNDRQEYQYNHTLTEGGSYYFRLRMIDRDSTERLSDITSLVWQNRNQVLLYPNPAGEQLIIARRVGTTVPLEIYDMQGRLVQTGMLDGLNTVIPLGGLKNGSYVLRFADNGRPAQFIFIKK